MSWNRPVAVRCLGVALALASVAGAGCSGGGGHSKVAATVDGDEIASSEIAKLTRQYGQTPQGKQMAEKLGEDELERTVLSFEIKTLILEQTAKEKGVSVDAKTLKGAISAIFADEAHKNVYQQAGYSEHDVVTAERSGALSKALAEKMFPDVAVSDQELRDLFKGRAKVYERVWQVEADIAVFESATEAEQLKARVEKGEPFGEVANDLGSLQSASVVISPASPLPPEIIEQVGPIAKGAVSEPLAAGSLWYTVKVNEREDIPARTFDEVKGELTTLAMEQKRHDLFQNWFDKHIRRVRVEVGKGFGKWDRSTGTVR